MLKSVQITALRRFSVVRKVHSLVENKVTIGKFNVNYVKAGKNEKNGVILLPGALGSAKSDFKPQMEALPQLLPNHTIVAWDPPGYGKSTPPTKTFSLDFYEEDAKVADELMQNLGFKSYSVLGWSDGGITGMFMGALNPDTVEKLVIWGSNAYVIKEEIEIYESIRDVSKWSEKMRQPMEEMYGKEGFPKLWSEWIDALKAIYTERGGNICKDKLANIKCPTLIVHGAKDPMIVPEHVPFLQNNIKNTELHVFPDGKHNIHLRYAKEFNEIVVKFLLK